MKRADPLRSDKSASVPDRSLTQRLDALNRANDVRTRRAMLKKDLKAGRHSIHTLLLDPPEFILTAKVFDMLLAVPMFGRVKVNKVLAQCRISPSKTIGGLSERQRDELVELIRSSQKGSRGARADQRMSAAQVRKQTVSSETQLRLRLEALLDEAREVGRSAGGAALLAGEDVHAAAPKPDHRHLLVGLRSTLP